MTDGSLENRTEEPSPRRILQARRAGEVAKSHDLATGVVVLAFCVAVVASGKAWFGGLLAYFHTAMAHANGPWTPSSSLAAGGSAACAALVVPLGILVLAAVLVNLAQTRGNLAPARMRPQGKRILPSLRRILGKEGAIEAGRSWLKILVILGVAGYTIRPWMGSIIAATGADSRTIVRLLAALARSLGIRLALALVVLGGLDYLWRLHRHRKAIRMTRQEAVREHREAEGDPLHRAERQRLFRELHDV